MNMTMLRRRAPLGGLTALPLSRAIAQSDLSVAARARIAGCADTGGSGFDATSWYGLLVPRATPPATLHAPCDVVEQILRAPDAARSIAQQGMVVMAEPPDIFTARIRRESAMWAEVIRTRRITPD